jgi:perosamine synthetase
MIISASLSPNTEIDDVLLAFRVLMQPWLWRRGAAVRKVELWFQKVYPDYQALSYNSGRSALLAILQAFGIHAGDEVLLQAFTCVAVPNSVLWAGAKPIYVDIDTSLNLDVIDAQKKITSKTRAIIVQHTLGIPAAMDKIVTFANKNNLLIIEDCAHSLGASFEGKKVGSFGDASFFSFGRDKILSSVFGGVGIIHKRHTTQWASLVAAHTGLRDSLYFWILVQLLHPIVFSFILPLYNIGIGKVILVIFQRLKLLSFPVYPEEKKSIQPYDFPAKYPNALALLLINQLKKIERYNALRKNNADYYSKKINNGRVISSEGSVFLRFPLFVDNPHSIIFNAKRSHVLLGNWYHNVIDPKGVDMAKINYIKGSCPRAEYASEHIINLPTKISLSQAKRVIRALA